MNSKAWFARAAALAALGLGTAAQAQIVVGQVAPFSGPQAVTGKAIHAGAQLYIDAVNAKGGVRGQRIKFVTRDDAQKPDETVRLVKAMIAEDQPVALLGTVGTTNLEALAKDGALVRAKTAMVGGVSGAATVAAAQGIHVVKASYRDEVARLFRQLAEVGFKRVGLVYQDDGLGRDVLEGAQEAAAKQGLQLVVEAGYARNTTEVAPAVKKVMDSAPQVVFLGATTAAAVEFVRQYGAAGGSAPLYGLSIIDTDALLKSLGPEKARGYAFSVVLPLVGRDNRAVVREYVALREASKDPDLSARSIEGFIAAKALVQALERTPQLTPAAVNATLAELDNVDVGGYTLDFSQRGRTGSRYVDFALIGAGGKLVH